MRFGCAFLVVAIRGSAKRGWIARVRRAAVGHRYQDDRPLTCGALVKAGDRPAWVRDQDELAADVTALTDALALDGDRSAVGEDGVVQFHRVQLLTDRDVDHHHRPEPLPRFDDLREGVGV